MWGIIAKNQMRKFLKFVHDDNVYYKYYEVVYIFFHTGMRISKFCGLTLCDIDLRTWLGGYHLLTSEDGRLCALLRQGFLM